MPDARHDPRSVRRAGRRRARQASGAPVRALGGVAALLVLVAGIVAAVAASTASVASAQAAPSEGVTSGGDAAAGHALYLTSCAACHGAELHGTADAPPLTGAGTALIDLMVRTGRMPLPEIGQPVRRGEPLLTDQQTRDLLAFVAPRTTGPAVPQVASGGDLVRGRDLFTTNCAACHGATGAGDAIGGGIVAPELSKSSPQDVAEAVVGGPPPMPRFSFAPSDLAAISAYVQYLREPAHPGGTTVAKIGPVAEGFVAGFVGLVALLVLVRWIGRPDRLAQRRPAPASDEPYSGEADR